MKPDSGHLLGDSMTKDDKELGEILRVLGPVYSKSDKSIVKLIDNFLWGNKKLSFYLIESRRSYSSPSEGVHAQFHIYVEDADSQAQDEPLFIILDTTHLNRAKDLWLKLQKLKDCLLGPDSKK